MGTASNLRRSGRRTVRPVEFWNFEKPGTNSQKILYNLSDLSKYSIYSPFSTKYLPETSETSAKDGTVLGKSSGNKVNETESAESGSQIVRNQKKLEFSPRDAHPHNSKENANEVRQKKIFNKEEESSVTCSVFKVPKGRGKRKDKPEAKSQDVAEGGRTKNVRANQEQCTSSVASTVNSESVTCRRSGRVRIKPLEFWNFEKVEIKQLENGEVSLIHHKQVLPSPKHKKEKEKEKGKAASHPFVTPKRNTSKILQMVSQEASPRKRKHTPFCNSLRKKASIEDGQPSKRKRTSGEKEDSALTPTIQSTKFNELTFWQRAAKDYKCYLARSFQDTQHDIYAGFIFLERGKVVWNTTKETNLYVIEGQGTLLMVDDTSKGVAVHLSEAFQTTVSNGRKISVQKGRCKMLKLFIVLGSSSGTSSAICQDSIV